jgi:DNA-directed RNA polymerase specialized sigma24 family protein
MIIISDYNWIAPKDDHLRSVMCYESQLVAAQSLIKDYVRKRVYNNSDVLDITQDINTIAIKKKSTYDKEYTFFGVKADENGLPPKFKNDGIIPSAQKHLIDPDGVNAIPQIVIFRKWICGISRFQVMAYLKKIKRSRLTYVDDIYSIHNPTDEHSIPSVSLIKKELSEGLSEEFDNLLPILSARERDVLKLLRLGYKNTEISKELSIKPCHVSAYKRRGINKMKLNRSTVKA